MSKLIYVADDEKNIRELIGNLLKKESFKVELFSDGDSLMTAFNSQISDMVILDINMPGLDGFSVCSQLRQKSNVPIVFVSARDTEPDKVAGFYLGSDEYIVKPFSPVELMARIKSIFRRIEFEHQFSEKSNSVITIQNLIVYLQGQKVEVDNKEVSLTLKEFEILSYLVQNLNRAIRRSELLNKVWGFEKAVETRATDDMIKRIRKKLLSAGAKVNIETIWGFGFKLSDGGV